MSEAGASTVAVTSDGSRAGALLHLVNAPDLQQAFGDNPLTILNEIARASDRDALRRLHLRARAFVLAQLTEPSTVDWLARFAERINVAIGRRLSALAGDVHADWSWCFYGAAGRCEALSAVQPSMTIICSDEADVPNALNALDRLRSGLLECGYLPVEGSSNISPCAAVSAWDERFTKWVRDPIGTQMHRALPLFDLRAAWGNAELVQQVAGVVRDAIGNDPLFGKLVAVDCLSSLPPLTFFQDAVLDESGESSGVFELESRALGPIVEVGRAFGIANGAVLSSSTLDRLDTARLRNPTGDAIFREAAETLRVLLFLQARTGLRLQNTGGEILPAQLSRFDRQALKSGFRAIHNLLEFTFQRLWKDAS